MKNGVRTLVKYFASPLLVLWLGCGIHFNGSVTTITLLETSDLHGNVMDWDFFNASPKAQGLVRIASLVARVRNENPDGVLLLDGGDTIQGTPMVFLYGTKYRNVSHPMALVMSAMHYDAMTIGNHEFNLGRKNLNKFIADASFPVLSANIRGEDGSAVFPPYILKKVKGVTVGILGLTTPGIPFWERGEHIKGLRFENPLEIAGRYISEMKGKGATVIVVLAHSGPDAGPRTPEDAQSWQSDATSWQKYEQVGDIPDENFIITLAEKYPEIDVICSGHTHVLIPSAIVNGVLIVQPGKWGRALSKVTLTCDKEGRVLKKRATLMWAKDASPDARVRKLILPYHKRTMEYVNSIIGTATQPFPGGSAARCHDGPLADLINTVQMDMARRAGFNVDVSSAAIFNNDTEIDRGPITVNEVYGIYQYDNTLYVMEITGKILRKAIEANASFWKQIPADSPSIPAFEEVIHHDKRSYNWDMYSGIEYTIDISRPVGSRVVSLTLNGASVQDNQRILIALNSYRASGGGDFQMFKQGKIKWQSNQEIRQEIVEFIERNGTIDPTTIYHQNWEIKPSVQCPEGK